MSFAAIKHFFHQHTNFKSCLVCIDNRPGYIILSTFIFAIPAMLLGPTKPPGRSRSLIDRTAFTDVSFLAYTLVSVFMFLGYAAPLFYIPVFGQRVVHTSADLVSMTLSWIVMSYTNHFSRTICLLWPPLPHSSVRNSIRYVRQIVINFL